jgi:NitT/TauT family transport system substrate-binding protein
MFSRIMHGLPGRMLFSGLVIALLATGCKKEHEYQIAWSVWTGWMPFKLMEAKGFLAHRAAEKGVNVKLVEFNAYMDSVTAFAAGQVDGCAMTSMEALQPAAAGIETVAIVANDTSNGGDGVLVRGIDDLRGLKGKEILLAELSVSHYLLVRGLDSVGLKERDVKIKNMDGDLAGKAFVTDSSVEAVTTWNPHLFHAVEGGKGKVIYSSKQIPGEIIDLLVMNNNALKEDPNLGWVLTEAWYDAMSAIEDPTTRDDSIKIMAAAAGASVEEFKKMLEGTDLLTDRRKAAELLESDRLKATMEKIKTFSVDHDLVKEASFTIGYGEDAAGRLRFDAHHARTR